MTIVSKIIVTVRDERIPIGLEGAQLCVQNAERLFQDSQSTSTPTKTALLEIGLEEVSKAWGILMIFEKKIFNENSTLSEYLKRALHLDEEKFNKITGENENKFREYLGNVQFENLINPFDEKSFSNHNAKINYLSLMIGLVKNISLPIFRYSIDREKLTRELLGKFIPKIELEDQDKIINEILNINTNNLSEIIRMKEKGLYVDIEGGSLISPSSRVFVPSILNDLLSLLIVLSKNEMVFLAKVLEEYDKNKK